MTLRRALLALSLVAVAAPAAASSFQSAPSAAAPAQPAPPPPSTSAPPAPAAAPSAQSAPAAQSSAAGETPVDPLAIAFDISTDHDAEDAAGPKLLKYVIDFVPVADAAGAQGKAYTLDLGKPKPVDGSISVSLTKVLLPGTYNAHVRAIGRGLRTSTVTVGPFVITEKIGKTKAEIDKELLAPDKPQPQDKRNRKPKGPTTENQSAAPPADTAPVDNVKAGEAEKTEKAEKAEKDAGKPARKNGFWKKVYEKVVGDPP